MGRERRTSPYRARLAGVLALIALILLLLLLRSTLDPAMTTEGAPGDESLDRGEFRDGSTHSRREGTRPGEEGGSHGGPLGGRRSARGGEGDGVRGGASGDSRAGGGSGGPIGRSNRPGRRLVPMVTGGGRTYNSSDLTHDWLADHQGADGSWNPASLRSRKTGVRTDGGGRSVHRTGVTGVALLSFTGAGETHKAGNYKKTIRAALDYLRKVQDRDGRFVPAEQEEALLGHVWATHAVAEDCALTGSPLYQPALRKAAAYLIDIRTDDGGWPRTEGSKVTDTDLTIWALLALHTTRVARAPLVPADVLADGLGWLNRITDGPTGLIPSTRHDEYDIGRDLWLTAGGAFARTLITNSRSSDALRMAVIHCMRAPPAWEEGRIDIPLWHLGTLALFQHDGPGWKTWNEAMKKAIIDHQRKDGDERGSWDPVGPWADQGGRVWSTAMLAMCLQVYYRYSRVPER